MAGATSLRWRFLGVCAGSLYFIAENYALRLTSTGNVSLLASISPIFTTILMAVFYRQRTKLPVWVGSIIAFTGAGCIVFSHGGSLEFSPVGDLIALSAAFSWGVYSVAIKRILPLYSSFFITRKMFFYGVLTALPLLLAQQEPYNLSILWDFSQPKVSHQLSLPCPLLLDSRISSVERGDEVSGARNGKQLSVCPADSDNDSRIFRIWRECDSAWLCGLRSYYRRSDHIRQDEATAYVCGGNSAESLIVITATLIMIKNIKEIIAIRHCGGIHSVLQHRCRRMHVGYNRS